jgi:hypothetical protein
MPATTAPPETESLKSPVVPAGLDSADMDQALARPEELLVQLQSQVGNQAFTSAVQRSPEDGQDGGVALAERVPSPDEVASELPTGGVLDDAATDTATSTDGGMSGGDRTDGGPSDGGLPGGVETPPDLLTGDAAMSDADRPPEGELRSGGADVEQALESTGPPVGGVMDGGGPADTTARGGANPPDGLRTGGDASAGPGQGGGTATADRTSGPPATDRADGGAPATGRADGGAPATDAPAADDAAAGSGGMDGALVETELAEHERWGSAAATVGGAESAERAGFIAEQVGGGMGEGFQSGAVAGALIGFGSKAITRAIGSRLPIPIIGSIIGGVIGAAGLYSAIGTAEGRAQIGNKLGAIGEGASGYEAAANTIDGLITILDLAANILDTVGLVCGVIAAVAWLGVFPSFGATSPIAATCTSIATAVGVASSVLSLVKMGLTPLVMLFRSLHTFTSEADPREVQAQGSALADTGKALGGTLGGLAGSKAGETAGGAAADRLGAPPETAGARYSDEPDSNGSGGGAAGDGPTVEAVPPDGPRAGAADDDLNFEALPDNDPRSPLDRAVEGIDRPETGWGEPIDPSDPRYPFHGLHDQEIDASVAGIGEDPRTSLDRALEGIDRPETGWGEPLDPADSRNPLRGASDQEIDDFVAGIGQDPDPRSSVDRAMEGIDRPETGWGEPFDPNDPRNPIVTDADVDMGAGISPVPEPVPSVIIDPSIEGVETIPAPPRPVDNRPQTDVDWYDPVTNPTGTVHLDDVRAMGNNPHGDNWHPDQLGQPLDPGGYRGELGQMKMVMDPATGMPMLDETGVPIREFAPEGTFIPRPEGSHVVRSGNPGGWGDGTTPPGQQGFDDATAAAAAAAADGSGAIRDRSALPVEWPGGAAGNPVEDMNVFPLTNPRNNPAVSPGQPHSNFQVPTIETVVAPQPEGAPGPGRPDFYPGGGPQVQVPGWHSPVPGDRDASRPFMTDKDPVTGRPLTGPGGQPLPSFPIDRTVINPLSPDAAVRQAEDWGTRTNERKVAGLSVGRWDAGMDAAQAGDLAKKALVGEDAPYRPEFAADDNPFAKVAGEHREEADAHVERVNPDYERPPGSPADLADMRAEIAHMRAAERLAEADVATADAHQAETTKRAGQIEQVTGTVEAAKEATKTQQGDVAATAGANAGQQERQEQAGTDLSTSASRMAGLGTLEVLLGGWATAAGATAGIFYLIGNVIDSANSAGDKCGASAADALKFMEKLTEAKMLVGGEAAKSPTEMGRLNQEKAALDAEKERAAATEGELVTARTGVDSAAEQNASDAANAAECRADGSTDAAEAAAAAEDRQAQHDQLQSDLQAWAERHAQQRADAVQATADRLTEEGYIVLTLNKGLGG